MRETELSVGHLVYPLFVTHGEDRREPIESIRSKPAVLEHHEERLIDVPELVSQVRVQHERRIGDEVRSDFSREIGRQLLRRLR